MRANKSSGRLSIMSVLRRGPGFEYASIDSQASQSDEHKSREKKNKTLLGRSDFESEA